MKWVCVLLIVFNAHALTVDWIEYSNERLEVVIEGQFVHGATSPNGLWTVSADAWMLPWGAVDMSAQVELSGYFGYLHATTTAGLPNASDQLWPAYGDMVYPFSAWTGLIVVDVQEIPGVSSSDWPVTIRITASGPTIPRLPDGGASIVLLSVGLASIWCLKKRFHSR